MSLAYSPHPLPLLKICFINGPYMWPCLLWPLFENSALLENITLQDTLMWWLLRIPCMSQWLGAAGWGRPPDEHHTDASLIEKISRCGPPHATESLLWSDETFLWFPFVKLSTRAAKTLTGEGGVPTVLRGQVPWQKGPENGCQGGIILLSNSFKSTEINNNKTLRNN